MIVYAITDPSTLDFTTLQDDLEHFASYADMIVYRDKYTNNYEANARRFLAQARGFKKVLLHTDYLLAARLDAEGVHLQSTQLDCIMKAKSLGLFVVVSTHHSDEAQQAEKLGADMITFSPVFDTPNKGKAVGLYALECTVSSVSLPVIALGGILTQEQIELCQSVGARGFASIRYFSKYFCKSL